MRNAQIALVLLIGCRALATGAMAQSLDLEIRQDSTRYNYQSQRGAPISSTVNQPPGSDGRAPTQAQQQSDNLTLNPPTPGQFQGLVSFGALVVPTNRENLDDSRSFAQNAANLQLPRFPAQGASVFVLQSARVGVPFVAQQISFLFGSVIAPPETDEKGALLSSGSQDSYWLAEPFTINNHAGAGYYWSPHARKVFAIQAGPLEITWKKAIPTRIKPPDYDERPQNYSLEGGNYFSLFRARYYVSGSAVKPPRRMYWTEGTFRSTGKPVNVPAARIGAVHIVYNSQFPRRVGSEFVAPSQSFITEENRLEETRTLWFDHQQGQIFAYNREGRVFLELLGDTREDGRTRRHLGFEIVDVIRQPNATDVSIELGERIMAFPDGRDDSNLTPEPLGQVGLQSFLYQHHLAGTDQSRFYAARETKNLNDVLVHWLEEGLEGLRWPALFVRYKLVWPDDVAKYSHYVRPLAATEGEAKETAVPLPIGNVPFIEYQDPFDRPRANLTDKFEFYTFLDPTVPAHRTLLRFTTDQDVAFERVFSWLNVNLRATNFVGTVATNLTAWRTNTSTFVWVNQAVAPRVHRQVAYVGERIRTPAGELGAATGEAYLAGYIRQSEGTSFNVNAYIDPFAQGFEAANRGAIIPINAIPGKNTLEVWWYRQNRADATRGFKPVYWPSVLARYTLEWPLEPREIILASNDGSGGLGNLEAEGRIYYQNDPTLPGYNPNEEHALMLGGQAYALRDDLNITAGNGYSSEPFVLLEYTEADGRIAMTPFKVLREKPSAGILFDYIVEAGTILQAPMPLPLLPKPVEGDGAAAVNYNKEPGAQPADLPANWNPGVHANGAYSHYNQFTYRDRKNEFWVYRGVHGGLPPLAAGRYIAETQNFAPLDRARAVVGAPFVYSLHVSRRTESIRVTAANETPLPSWLTLSGLRLFGTPAAGDTGSSQIKLNVTDTADQAQVTLTLDLTVAENGDVIAQAPLRITSTNRFSGTMATYTGRPPYLAVAPEGTNSFTMRFYYKTQEGFAWPGFASPPAVGAIVPYLRPKDARGNFVGSNPGSKDTPALDIVYRPVWPINPPKLLLGDTLTLPKAGLPTVRGQTSLQIVYEQSIAADVAKARRSVILHDATREKSFALDSGPNTLKAIPPSVRTYNFQGKVFFPNLPPHLAGRFFFDPNRGIAGHLVLRGQFHDEPLGEKFLMLNVLRDSDLAAVKALCPATDTQNKGKWDEAIQGLSTTLETFHENRAVPGQYIPNRALDRTITVDALAEITDDNTAVDSYALSAVGPGQGYVTLVAGDGAAFTPPGEPVSMHVLRVAGPLHPGELKMVPSANPLNELLTIQHSADLAGRFNDFEYEWKIAPPADGLPPAISPEMTGWTALASGSNIPFYTLGGAGIRVLIDNYLIMRYRPKQPDHPLFNQWSDWTRPQLAEGWIKRVLAGINPFNQRVTDLFNNQVSTDVSLLSQAGRRWEGDVALNLENINSFGLIEIYETVLRRGKMLSIDSGINFGPANDALLLAAGYLNDLYMLLGGEAWADAANPTIGIGTKDRDYGNIATALFAFKGQVASLLDEELALLRGRDDFLQPGVEISPVYNRLIWNYTRGIDSGEVIYALNYNIQENPNQNPDGIVNADDARRLFPQGHGDAYGHYLTALKGYYSLMMDTDFDWVPRIEAVTVLGQPVSVDYQDERKFAAAAAAVARAGKQVFDLTWRKDYRSAKGEGWARFSETRTNTRRKVPTTRYWGLDHWASRTGQGAYLNWIVGNAILPAIDDDPTHEGIQKVDRTTVPELTELPVLAESLQTAMDNAEAGLNPLGFSEAAIPFDLDPQSMMAAGDSTTHFEQIYQRAVGALRNALVAFDDAKDVTQLMRSEADSLADLQAEIASQELAYTNALIELYGTPYPDDIGPGKTYKTGYAGPDLLHYMYVENPELRFPGLIEPTHSKPFKIDIQNLPSKATDFLEGASLRLIGADLKDVVDLDAFQDADRDKKYIEYHWNPHGFFGKPSQWKSRRASPGAIQQAISEVIKASSDLLFELENHVQIKNDLDGAIKVFEQKVIAHDEIRQFQNKLLIAKQTLDSVKFANDAFEKSVKTIKEKVEGTTEAAIEALPKSVIGGTSFGGDATSPGRASVKVSQTVAKSVFDATLLIKFIATSGFQFATETAERFIHFNEIETREWDQERREAVHELAVTFRALQSQLFVINNRIQVLDEAQRNYQALLAQGDRVLQEREIFRQRSAALIQGFRARDAAFRIFRNEKLERYKTLFDLAARYAFLAAQSYDYDTGLLHTRAGKDFINRIVQARALGVVQDGEPQFAGSNTGDPGLSSALAEMAADYGVLESRLGFNNPDQYDTTVSLRTEQYRILPGPDGETNWRDVLQQGRMSDLRADEDVRRSCMRIDNGDGRPVPGIILSFSTTIADGFNLFGKPLAAGDHAFSPSSFATKIYGVGVAFDGYRGMERPSANATAVNFAGALSPSDPTLHFLDPGALSATPFVYLIPAGVDSMRSPPLGDSSAIRTWTVDDVTIPMPFNIGASSFSTKQLYRAADSLTDQLFSIRKHQAFRAVPSTDVFAQGVYGDDGIFLPTPFTSRRLIGRSVWNSKWKLVIPGKTLLSDPAEGLDRFIQTVKDIKLHFITYSYSGN